MCRRIIAISNQFLFTGFANKITVRPCNYKTTMATEDKNASKQVNNTTEKEEQEEDVELSDEYDSNDEYEDMSCYQEDAMLADKYEDDGDGPYKTHEQKLERLLYLAKKVENKEYCPKTLREVYPDVEVVTPSELNNRVQIANAHVNAIADKQKE